MQTAPGSNLTQQTFIEFYEEYHVACERVTESLGYRRDVMKRAKSNGIDGPAFLFARKQAEMSGDLRQRIFGNVQLYMGMLGKPYGTPEVVKDETINEHQRRQVEEDGYHAGRHGYPREDYNKWSPGTLLYETFSDGWARGAADLEQARATAGNGADESDPTKPRRGRPRGSRNRPKDDNGADDA